jgi:hypothetical protein
MYIILGADGREYGPVSAEQLRQWITEGRANAQTRVRIEGATDWRTLGELAEFFPPLSSQSPSAFVPPPFPISTPARTNQLAVAGLILGVLSLTVGCCCYGLPFNVAGIVCSSIALSQISKDSTQQGKGYAIAGLVLSILSLLGSGLLWGLSFSGTNLFRKLNRL